VSRRESTVIHGDLTGTLAVADVFAGPRVAQSIVTILFAIDLALRFGGDAASGRWPQVGAGTLAIVTLATFVTRWERLPASAPIVVAVADIAVMGLTRLDAQGGASGILLVLPAIYLGRYHGRRGVVVTVLAGVLLQAVPGLVYFGPDGPNASRTLLSLSVAVVASLAMASAVSRLEYQRRVSAAIVDSVDVGLVLIDADGVYQSMNRRHLDFMELAYPSGHQGLAGQLGLVYGADATTLLSREDMPTARAANREEFDDLRIWVGDDEMTRRALSVSARMVWDESEEFAGAALAYKDVTDFMRALQVKDEFVSSVSHELRTPLTSIHGYALLLLEQEDLAAQTRAHLSVISRNTERLQRLVDDLLHTAQVDEDGLHVERTDTDISQVVRDAVQAAEPAARTHGVSLSLDAPAGLVVKVDPQRIAQVVDNLVSNALKYTPAGGDVTVAVVLDGSRVEISVSDTGVGIDAADRDRLFTRFFRARIASEREIQGVGLGLNITRSIVEGHGGRIEVESEPGRGSTFRVRLPVGAGTRGLDEG